MKNYVGFSKRLTAYIIDGVVFSVPYYMVFGLRESYTITEYGIYFILWTAYFVWMVGMYGATIGKMIMKVKIVKEDGSKVSYADALVRELASYLSFIVIGLGFLNIIWDSRKQGWHDKIAKTVVVKT